MGASYGGFGGGLGSDIEHFGDRFDFDAAAYWEIRNLGHGDAAARSAARARIDQARYRQIQIMDQVASEIAEAHAQVVARRQQLEAAEEGVRAATASYRRNTARIRDAQGLPLEVLQSLQALDQSRRQYLRVVAGYNEAQFRLQRALGNPI
jgi:outer membrane protein TolC